MKIENIKQNLNKKVRYKPLMGEESIYKLKACLIERDEINCQYNYIAKLQDIKSPWSVCFVPLSMVESLTN